MEALEYFFGLAAGLFTGLLPGLHPNTLSSIIAQMPVGDEAKAFLIVGMAAANLVTAFIAAIFFGIPDQSAVVAVLPAHRMTLAGRGLTALRIVLFSAVSSAILSFLLFMPSLEAFAIVYPALKDLLKYIVLFLSALMIARSRNPPAAFAIFIAAGLLGCCSLNFGLADPFMPLFSGMFAVASLLSISRAKLPVQKKEERMEGKTMHYVVLGVFLGFFADLLPAISSPAQVASLASAFIPLETIGYLAMITAISVSQLFFSFSTLVSIDKSRVGTTAWLSKFANILSQPLFFAALFLFGVLLVSLLLYVLRSRITSLAVLNSRALGIILIIYLVAVCFIINGFFGLLVMLLSSILGYLALRGNVERTHLMGAVIVPTLLLLFRVFLF